MAKKRELKKNYSANPRKADSLIGVRVRIAPSPTGALHIGTARSALFNYLFAKKNKGQFILRIEDTDRERSELRWVQDIIDGLKWLGIEWDEGPDIDGKFGPYKQSQRSDIYKKYLKKLLEENKVYYCFCTTEELEDSRQEQMSRGLAPKYDGKCAHLSNQIIQKNLAEQNPSVIRFRTPDKKVKFNDMIRGDVEFDMSLAGDIIIAKDPDTPLYNFTVAVDDFEMQISHVIRGEDHISNTPKQILLQEAMGFPHPEYGHLPLILAPDRSKISKRFGAVSVTDYKAQGYLPEALINFMSLLGWNPGTEKEVFSLSQLTKEFSIEKIQKSGAIFNIQRLDFLNGLYIREKSIDKLTELCVPYLKEAGLLIEGQISPSALQKIIEVSKTRMKKLSDIIVLSDFFFKDKLSFDKDLLQWPRLQSPAKAEDYQQNRNNLDFSTELAEKAGDGATKDSLLFSEKILSGIKKWELKNLEKELLIASENFNLEKGYPEKNKGYLLWPLRVALSGKDSSPSPFEIADILGKEKTLKRIEEAIKLIS